MPKVVEIHVENLERFFYWLSRNLAVLLGLDKKSVAHQNLIHSLWAMDNRTKSLQFQTGKL